MKVGSRESKLAMRQTNIFVERMATANPDEDCEIVGMKALGDIDLKSRLDQLPTHRSAGRTSSARSVQTS